MTEATERVLSQAHGENFPVALRLLPASARRHLTAVYGFARLVDDAGDEAPGDRSALLDALERDLDRVYSGERAHHPLMRRLADTVSACHIPREPFAALVAANRQDQTVTRYATFDDLVGYCRLSASPVGHVVLHVFGRATPERVALSDRVCTALQVVEHCQDVAEDLRRGRVYLPGEDLARLGVDEEDLATPVASPRVRALVALECRRAARLLDTGAPIVGTLSGPARLAVAGFVAGGRAALASIRSVDHDVLAHAARPRPARVLAEGLRVYATGGRR